MTPHSTRCLVAELPGHSNRGGDTRGRIGSPICGIKERRGEETLLPCGALPESMTPQEVDMIRRVVFPCVAAIGVAMMVVAVAAQQAASDDALIKSAMSAAPSAIGNDATVIDASADGKMRTVRKGTNNFTCMANNPRHSRARSDVRRRERHGVGTRVAHEADAPGKQGGLHVHVGWRQRCQQHRPARAKAHSEQ